MDVSCVIVGDEILSGHVQDANGHFIAARIASTGHRLRRISIVPDDPARIAGAIRADRDELRPGLVLVCGGLGPTHDDRTMESVADALGLPLEPCAPLAERVRAVVAHMRAAGFSGDPLGVAGLEKMALAPAGAEHISCSIGVIPAVTIVQDGVRYVVLPGPPRELQAVFLESVEPLYLTSTGTPVTRFEVEHLFPESSLASALIEIEARIPSVSLGSYPLDDRVVIRIAGPEDDAKEAAAKVRRAIESLESSEEGRRLLTFFRERPAHRHD